MVKLKTKKINLKDAKNELKMLKAAYFKAYGKHWSDLPKFTPGIYYAKQIMDIVQIAALDGLIQGIQDERKK